MKTLFKEQIESNKAIFIIFSNPNNKINNTSHSISITDERYFLPNIFDNQNQQEMNLLAFKIIDISIGILYFLILIFKKDLAKLLAKKCFYEKFEMIKDIDSNLLNSITIMLPIKNYVFKNYLTELKYFAFKRVSTGFRDYKGFFFELATKNKDFKKVINSNLTAKNTVKCIIYISLVHIIILVCFYIITFKLLAYYQISTDSLLHTILHLLFLKIIIITGLFIIIDINTYINYYQRLNSHSERMYLCNEFDEECNIDEPTFT